MRSYPFDAINLENLLDELCQHIIHVKINTVIQQIMSYKKDFMDSFFAGYLVSFIKVAIDFDRFFAIMPKIAQKANTIL